MFNIWPFNTSKNIIDSMPKWEWVGDIGFTVDGKPYTPSEIINEFIKLKDENKNLEDILKSIEEDGTVEHNNAIKLREENVQLKHEIDNYKKGNRNWANIYHQKIATIDELIKKNEEIENELSLIEIEQEAIVAANHKMAQALKEKNDRVILLENAVDRWSSRAVSWEKQDEELKSNISELTKEVLNLRHLKTENVELMERVNEIDNDVIRDLKDEILVLKNDYAVLKAKHQIVNNDYSKCTEQRDEYKHQLNASNNEIEALKNKLRDYQDKYAESFSHNDMNGLQKEIDDLKLMYKERESKLKTYNTSLLGQIAGLKEENEKLNLQVTALHKIVEGAKNTIDEQKSEIKKLQDDIVDYVIKKDDEIKELKTEKYYVCNHCGYKVAHDTNYYGGCGFCKDGLMIEKEEVVQKHPMYPIHWGTLDPDIHEKAKNINIEEAIKDVAKAEVEFNSEELLERVTEYADTLQDLPKTFSNEFQEETTAENLEEKFDRGENVMDYFKPYHCPCNMCKHAREENTERSWEEAASDLALRVVKLEKKVEELINIKHTCDPYYKYFLKHGKWPFSAMNPDGTLKTIPCNISSSDYNSNIKGTI